MYSIEYSTFAGALLRQQIAAAAEATATETDNNNTLNQDATIDDDQDDDGRQTTPRRRQSASPLLNTLPAAAAAATSHHRHHQVSKTSTDELIAKLKSMQDCPSYLLPTLPAGITSAHASISSASSSSVKSKKTTTPTTTVTKSKNSTTSTTAPTTPTPPRARLVPPVNYYTDDFILLSEFSEIEGPRPLLTIPTDGATGFNKNDYALHLMCVDFHSHLTAQSRRRASDASGNGNGSSSSSSRGSSSSGLNPSNFSLSKDTTILNYWDESACVAACVRHFTLYDVEARGFVRPFCLAYVSYDAHKPVDLFAALAARFAHVTALLKRSNLNAFKHDLTQRCADIAYTRDLFAKWSSTTTTTAGSNERTRLVDEHKLDAATVGKLNACSLSSVAASAQLEVMNSALREMEGILDVVQRELIARNWLATPVLVKKKKKKNNNKKTANKQPQADFSHHNGTHTTAWYRLRRPRLVRALIDNVVFSHHHPQQQPGHSPRSEK